MSEFDIESFGSRLLAKNLFDGNLQFGAGRFHRESNRSGKGKPADGGLVSEHAKIVHDTEVERFQRVGEFWENVGVCPVCSGTFFTFFLSRLGLDIWRCQDCSHGFQNPRITFGKASELYANDKTASDIYTQPIQKDIDRVKYEYGLDVIGQLPPPDSRKIMDIGCGAGGFLMAAHARGWETCVGIDVNERYSSIYRESTGVQFVQSSFEELNHEHLGNDYDVITMWNVLEHIYDLQSVLGSITTMLKPGGLLFIMVPNVESLATRLIREKSATFNWKHVSHFSPMSLEALMSRHGLKTELLETAISEIDNVKSYLSGEYPYHGYGDPEGHFDFITPRFIHERLMGSRLLAVFRNA